ncbi:hypothetical protein FLG15_02375 [Xanthomonas phaseoli pv. dieffenbachiae]
MGAFFWTGDVCRALGRSLLLFLQAQPLRRRGVRPGGTRTVGVRAVHAQRSVGRSGRGVVLALSATF